MGVIDQPLASVSELQKLGETEGPDSNVNTCVGVVQLTRGRR